MDVLIPIMHRIVNQGMVGS